MLLAAFALYFALIVAVSLLAYRKSRSASEFLLGNRSLNFYVTALSAHASDMSSWLFMGYPASILLAGGIGAWAAVGLVFGMWANWRFIAPRLRSETERTSSLTLSDYFAKRFQDPFGLIRTISALASLLFFTAYVAAGLVGVGFLVESVLGLDRLFAMAIGVAIVVGYTLIGGYHAVCWVDLFQALFLLCMIILVPLVVLGKIGGFAAVQAAATDSKLFLTLLPPGGYARVGEAILLSFGWGLGYFGQTHILSKFMGIRNPAELKRSMRVGLTWQVLCLAAATLIGLVGIAFIQHHPDNPELIFINLVKQYFHPFLGGLILCGIMAAAISTMDSQLLVLVPALSQDIYHRFFRRSFSQKEALWSSRICVLLVGLTAYLIAATSAKTVQMLVYYSWAGLGSTFGPVLLLALYSKRVNWQGALAGMVVGLLVAAFWPTLMSLMAIQIPTLVPGFLGNLGVIYAVSLASRRASPSVERTSFRAPE